MWQPGVLLERLRSTMAGKHTATEGSSVKGWRNHMHAFERSPCLLCEGWAAELEPSSRDDAVMHTGNDEFLNHDSSEGLERKECIQEIFNRPEQNLKNLSSIWTGSITQARAKDQGCSSYWNHSGKAQIPLYAGRGRSHLHIIMSGACGETVIQKYVCHPLSKITPLKQHSLVLILASPDNFKTYHYTWKGEKWWVQTLLNPHNNLVILTLLKAKWSTVNKWWS